MQRPGVERCAMRMVCGALIGFLAYLALPLSLFGDEVDDALSVEKVVRGQAGRRGKVMANDTEISVLVAALQKKHVALVEARAEITRLKGVVLKIRDANRREYVKLHYNMGCIYKSAKQYQKAEVQFLKALEKDPSDAGVHYNLGILYNDDLKDAKKAKLHYERFLSLASDRGDIARVEEWLASLMDEGKRE